ncbi:MAG: hypothetical protein ACTID3_08710 [Halomonas sp.]|uniref:hypothetical protein n=1 Tax=Halomonas sp. TaxID=1486246 RepID=UPI003F8DA74D
MSEHDRYLATQWRKRLERKGWISLRRSPPPGHRLIDFHVIWKGQLYSGRIVINRVNAEAISQPGSTAFLIKRTDQITEGVWRLSAGGEAGMVRRPWRAA